MLNFLNKTYKEITPKKLSERMREEKLILIDCREEDELEICRVDGFRNIPMQTIPNHLQEFNKNDELFIMCRTGARSGSVCEYLEGNGFKNVYNVIGGVHAWSDEVDSSLQKY